MTDQTKEAIDELLVSARKEHNNDCLLCAVKDTRIDQALTLLRTTPEQIEAENEKLKEMLRDYIEFNNNEFHTRKYSLDALEQALKGGK